MTSLKCNPANHYVWGSGLKHGRVDYDSDDHTFEQMCSEEYFGPIFHVLRAGDYISITDRDRRLFEVIVDEIDNGEKLVRFSLMRERVLVPVAKKDDHGHAIRWKGPHHKWVIFDHDGAIVEAGLSSRDKAERSLELHLAKKAA